jgi:DNA replication and repair protein RecO
MRLTDTAFVLHTRPWRETSLLVEVLGREQGRLGVIARGVQGPKNTSCARPCSRCNGSGWMPICAASWRGW